MDQARPSCELSTHPTMRSRFPQIGRPVPLMNPIRRRPCADPGQKQVPGEWMTQKGIDSSRPVTEASHAMKKSIRVSHHGHTETTRHSPRNGFTAYFALSSVTTLFDTVACASSHRLDAKDWGVGTTRLRRTQADRVRLARCRVHRIPPRVRDDREPPLHWDETVRISELICPRRQAKFLKIGNRPGHRARARSPQERSIRVVFAGPSSLGGHWKSNPSASSERR